MSYLARTLLIPVVLVVLLLVSQARSQDREDYLSWSASEAVGIGKKMRVSGRVGGPLDIRVTRTERSYNFKLRATWLTSDVIRTGARLEQLRKRLSDDQTRALVAEAEAVGDTVILVEIDPREGSGVIPLDWQAYLQPKGSKSGEPGSVIGTNDPELREVKALSGVAERDYAYDVFWVVFPLVNNHGEPLFSDSVQQAELIVRIYNKEGRVGWAIPSSVRDRARVLAEKKRLKN